MRDTILKFSSFVLLFFLIGCVVPMNYSLDVKATPKELALAYNGDMLFVQVFSARDEMGRSDKAKTMAVVDDAFRQEALKYGGSYQSEYSLDGLISMESAISWPYTQLQRKNFGNLIKITTIDDGRFRISSEKMSIKDANHLKSLGADLTDIRGAFTFEPAEGVKVLKHNANSEPGLFSSKYKWDHDLVNNNILLEFEVVELRKEIIAERERVAAEKKKKRDQEFNTWFDSYVAYHNSIEDSRKTVKEIYTSIEIENVSLQITEEKRTFTEYRIHTSFDVVNNGNFPVRLSGIQLYFYDYKGERRDRRLYEDAFSNRILNPGERVSIKDDPYRLTSANSSIHVRNFLKHGYTCAIFPRKVYLNGKEIKPSGQPLIRKKPELPSYVGWRSSEQVAFKNRHVNEMLNKGLIKPLSEAPSDFPEPKRFPVKYEPGTTTKKATPNKSIEQKTTQQNIPERSEPPVAAGKSESTSKPEAHTQSPDTSTAADSKKLKAWSDPVSGIEFVWIPAGCFQMGSVSPAKGNEGEGPVHEVCLNGFWLSRYEITNKQFKLFKTRRINDFNGYPLDQPDQPAVYVSWDDAKNFASWLNNKHSGEIGFRLPTEAEWEYAARAGTTTSRFWGDDPSEACKYANTADKQFKKINLFDTVHSCDDGYAVSSPVGQFQPNRYGLYDMLGNVWEWCEDWYDENAYKAHERNNPVFNENTGKRVLRGGSWRYGPNIVRSAQRAGNKPGDRQANIGFRLVKVDGGLTVLGNNESKTEDQDKPQNGLEEINQGLEKVNSILKKLPF